MDPFQSGLLWTTPCCLTEQRQAKNYRKLLKCDWTGNRQAKQIKNTHKHNNNNKKVASQKLQNSNVDLFQLPGGATCSCGTCEVDLLRKLLMLMLLLMMLMLLLLLLLLLLMMLEPLPLPPAPQTWVIVPPPSPATVMAAGLWELAMNSVHWWKHEKQTNRGNKSDNQTCKSLKQPLHLTLDDDDDDDDDDDGNDPLVYTFKLWHGPQWCWQSLMQPVPLN